MEMSCTAWAGVLVLVNMALIASNVWQSLRLSRAYRILHGLIGMHESAVQSAIENALHEAYNVFENITVAESLEEAKNLAHRYISTVRVLDREIRKK